MFIVWIYDFRSRAHNVNWPDTDAGNFMKGTPEAVVFLLLNSIFTLFKQYVVFTTVCIRKISTRNYFTFILPIISNEFLQSKGEIPILYK